MTHLPELKDFLSTSRRIVIVTHHKPDADALGSSLGLSAFLKKSGHTVSVITPSDYPTFLNWMSGNENVVIFSETKKSDITKLIDAAELIFCLDFSVLGRITDLGELVRKSPVKKVLIDHHLQPEKFAHFELWDNNAASTAGLVYELMMDLNGRELIDGNIADCLYAGVMTDTGGFRHNNTRRQEFLIAADLVTLGANPNRVSKLIYDTNTLVRLRLMGYVLSEKLTIVPEFHTAYIVLSQEELRRFGSQTGDTEGFVNYGLSIEGIRLSVLIYERSNEIKLSFRSLDDFSVNELARTHFEGGGHKNASGGSSKLSLQQTVQKFLDILPAYKDKLV